MRVHYNSVKPAQFQALAYTQGNQVFLSTGQEKYLTHELGHVIQQKQNRVKQTLRLNGIPANDDDRLEKEADIMYELTQKESNNLEIDQHYNDNSTPIIQRKLFNIQNEFMGEYGNKDINAFIEYTKKIGLPIEVNFPHTSEWINVSLECLKSWLKYYSIIPEEVEFIVSSNEKETFIKFILYNSMDMEIEEADEELKPLTGSLLPKFKASKHRLSFSSKMTSKILEEAPVVYKHSEGLTGTEKKELSTNKVDQTHHLSYKRVYEIISNILLNAQERPLNEKDIESFKKFIVSVMGNSNKANINVKIARGLMKEDSVERKEVIDQMSELRFIRDIANTTINVGFGNASDNRKIRDSFDASYTAGGEPTILSKSIMGGTSQLCYFSLVDPAIIKASLEQKKDKRTGEVLHSMTINPVESILDSSSITKKEYLLDNSQPDKEDFFYQMLQNANDKGCRNTRRLIELLKKSGILSSKEMIYQTLCNTYEKIIVHEGKYFCDISYVIRRYKNKDQPMLVGDEFIVSPKEEL